MSRDRDCFAIKKFLLDHRVDRELVARAGRAIQEIALLYAEPALRLPKLSDSSDSFGRDPSILAKAAAALYGRPIEPAECGILSYDDLSATGHQNRIGMSRAEIFDVYALSADDPRFSAFLQGGHKELLAWMTGDEMFTLNWIADAVKICLGGEGPLRPLRVPFGNSQADAFYDKVVDCLTIHYGYVMMTGHEDGNPRWAAKAEETQVIATALTLALPAGYGRLEGHDRDRFYWVANAGY